MVEGSYGPGVHSFDVSQYEWVDAALDGAAGEDGEDTSNLNGGDGGVGGAASGRVDVTGASQMTLYVADGRLGGSTTDSAGDGGVADDDASQAPGGDGAGVTAIQLDGQAVIGAGGGGGGGGGGNQNIGAEGGGGGGGAWGGLGGSGSTDGEDGDPGPSTNGGDGGDSSGSADADDGLPGDGWTDGGVVSSSSTTTGGGRAVHSGSIEITDSSFDVSPPENLTATETGDASVALSWTDTNDVNDGHRIYRDTEAGVTLSSGNLIADIDAAAETYTDETVAEGRQYYYVVVAYIQDEEAASNEADATTVLPAPTNLSIDAIDNDSAELSWSDNATDEEGYRIYQRLAGETTWTEMVYLPAGSQSATAEPLENGREHELEVAAYTVDVEERTTTVSDTTTLPDVDALALDASVEDELTAEPATTPPLNHGEWRVQYREDGETEWIDWGTTGYQNDATITGLLDGQRYDVRVRSQTLDVTGAYFETSQVTLLPAPTNLSISNIQADQLDLSWTDNADNEIAQQVQRRRDLDDYPFTTVATVDSNVESHTDETVQPTRTYEYRIRTETEYVYADSTLTTASTPDSGRPQRRTRRQRWTVEIDVDEDTTIRPEVLDEPTWSPGIIVAGGSATLPSLEIPVAASQRYRDGAGLTGSDARVWYQGTQLPIDELYAVSKEPGRVVLECRGGSALRDYIDDVQIASQETHLFLRDLIGERTPYTHTVDDPDAQQTIRTLLTQGAFQSHGERLIDFEDLEIGFGIPDRPVALPSSGEGITVQQSGWFESGVDASFSGQQQILESDDPNFGDWVDNRAVRLGGLGDNYNWETDYDYTIPEGTSMRFSVYLAHPEDQGDSVGLDFIIDGTVVDSLPEGALLKDADRYDTRWFNLFVSAPNDLTGDVSPRVEVTGGSGNVYIDVGFLGDGRYNYGEDANTVDGHIYAPRLYSVVPVEIIDATSVFQVLGGQLSVSTDDTSNEQALAVSNDGGDTWLEQSNTDTMTLETFGDPSQRLRGRMTLSYYGDEPGVNRPSTGYQGQSITSWTLEAELDDTPVLLDKQYRDRVVDILPDAFDSGNFVGELRRTPGAAPEDQTGYVLEVTTAGQRQRERIPERLIDYQQVTTVEGRFDRIIVFGQSNTVRGAEFSTLDYDTGVSLGEEWIVSGSETIQTPDGETTFERDVDYELNYKLGTLTPLESGDMQENTTYVADFDWRHRGEASVDGVGDPETLEERIPDASSDLECAQLAEGILRRVREPLQEASVTVQLDDPTLPFVEALDHPDLPGDAVQPRDVDFGERSVTLTLGSRRPVREIIDELRGRLRGVADQV